MNKSPRGTGLHIQCTLEPQTFASLVVLLQEAAVPFRPTYSDVLRTLVDIVIRDLTGGKLVISDPEEALLLLEQLGFSTSQFSGHRKKPIAKTLSLSSLQEATRTDSSAAFEQELKDLLSSSLQENADSNNNP